MITNSPYFGVFGSKVSLASKYARILALSRSFFFTNFLGTFDFWYAFSDRSQTRVQCNFSNQTSANVSLAVCALLAVRILRQAVKTVLSPSDFLRTFPFKHQLTLRILTQQWRTHFQNLNPLYPAIARKRRMKSKDILCTTKWTSYFRNMSS